MIACMLFLFEFIDRTIKFAYISKVVSIDEALGLDQEKNL